MIEKKLKALLERVTGREVKVEQTGQLKTECGIDSLALVEIVCSIEEEFGIVFSPEELTDENLSTFGGLLKLVENKL